MRRPGRIRPRRRSPRRRGPARLRPRRPSRMHAPCGAPRQGGAGIGSRMASAEPRPRDVSDPAVVHAAAAAANASSTPFHPSAEPTASRIASQPSPWRSRCRCSSSTRGRSDPSAVKRTSNSLVFDASPSRFHCQPPRAARRSGGLRPRAERRRHAGGGGAGRDPAGSAREDSSAAARSRASTSSSDTGEKFRYPRPTPSSSSGIVWQTTSSAS
jgi:hypothetical protein